MSPTEQAFITEAFNGIKSQLSKQDKVLESLDHAINGNGSPGLKVTVDRHDKTLKFMRKAFWIIITPALAAVGSGAVAGVVYMVRSFK